MLSIYIPFSHFSWLTKHMRKYKVLKLQTFDRGALFRECLKYDGFVFRISYFTRTPGGTGMLGRDAALFPFLLLRTRLPRTRRCYLMDLVWGRGVIPSHDTIIK